MLSYLKLVSKPSFRDFRSVLRASSLFRASILRGKSTRQNLTVTLVARMSSTENGATGPDGQPLSKSAMKKLEKEKEKARKKAERQAQLAEQAEANEGEDFSKDCYGNLPLNQSHEKTASAEERVIEQPRRRS